MIPFSQSNPDLAAWWHPTRNGDTTPDKVGSGSNKKIWWQCPKNKLHEWQARCPDRVKAPGCPFCRNQRILAGDNDLATTHPHLAAQWHPTQNGDLGAHQVGSGSSKKVWWQCDLDERHQWPGVVKDRARGGGCPVCSGQLVLPGVNDMATTRPDLAAQWHPTLNGTLKPTQVVAGGARSIWWQCAAGKDHVWKAKGSDRATGGNGCPFCSNKKVLAGFNDMATTQPDLAAQWHPTLNGALKPTQVTAGTQKAIVWQCGLGHSWSATGSRRTSGEGCPFCANKRVMAGFNDMATVAPELALEFDLVKNAPLTPQEVVTGTGKKLWWKCLDNPSHSWYVKGSDRVIYKTGCPHCWYESETSTGENEVAALIAKTLGEKKVKRNHYLTHKKKRRNYDIVIPELKVAIEFNGVYYHSERCGRDSDYHAEKHRVATAAGYQLITVWQDDWENKKEIVATMLAHKLGASTLPRIAARNTTVVAIDAADALEFLEQHHIQGSATGSIRLALKPLGTEEIAAVLVARVDGNTAEIVRYATSSVVAGGFSKLLKALEQTLAQKNANGAKIDRIKTFSDHMVSDGSLYAKCGFTRAAEIPPDYCYLVGSKRVHKANYRIARFKTDESLLYVVGETEAELADRNKLARIWDAGKTRWEKEL